MTTYVVEMHDGCVAVETWSIALEQAYLDSCSTFLPVSVYEAAGGKIATVQAHPVQETDA